MRNPGRSGAAAGAVSAVRAANKGSLWFTSDLCGAANPGCSRLSAGACRMRRLAHRAKELPEKRLQARLPAPQWSVQCDSWRRLFGDAGDVRSVIGQAAIELAQPLGIHKRFQDAEHLEAVFTAAQLAQKSEVHNLLDVAIHPVHQLGFVG